MLGISSSHCAITGVDKLKNLNNIMCSEIWITYRCGHTMRSSLSQCEYARRFGVGIRCGPQLRDCPEPLRVPYCCLPPCCAESCRLKTEACDRAIHAMEITTKAEAMKQLEERRRLAARKLEVVREHETCEAWRPAGED